MRRLSFALSLMFVAACAGEPDVDGAADEVSGVAASGGSGGAGGAGGGEVATGPCAIDCATIATPACQVAECNAQTGQCEVVPAAAGSPCDDGLYCTVNESCLEGVCGGGAPNECGMDVPPCVTVTCDEVTQTCSKAPADEGAACDSDDLCLVNSTCKNGLCVGTPKDCFFAPVPNACHVGVCNPGTGECDPVPGNDGKECPNDGDLCMVEKTCVAGACQGGVPKDCSALDDNCNLGVCEPSTGDCLPEAIPPGGSCSDAEDECNVGICDQNGDCQPVPTPGVACASATDACNNGFCSAAGVCLPTPTNEGGTCNDGNSCTTGESCQAGLCTGGVVGEYVVYFSESFASNAAQWNLGAEWQIGPALASSGQDYGGPDPATDHTASSDNGVAGVQIGGNAITPTVHPPQYLTSPSIDLSGVPGQVYVEFWRWLNSDYTPYMKNTIDVYNGTQWVNLWSSGGSPGVQDSMWTKVSFDLTPYKNSELRVRFGFEIGSSGVFDVSSWNIDDFVIANQVCN